MLKISKEVAGIVVLWATWLSSSIIYLMVKVAVLEDRSPIHTASVKHTRNVQASMEIFHLLEPTPWCPAKKEKK